MSAFCQGTLATTSRTRSRARALLAFTAATRWPTWMGSNVPPRIPIRWPMTDRRYGILTTALLLQSLSAILVGYGSGVDTEQMAGAPGRAAAHVARSARPRSDPQGALRPSPIGVRRGSAQSA